MMQEDSNGENSFEIIDKKAEELCIKGETTDSASSISSSYSIPSPSLVNAASGVNLLANVPPPAALPEYWPMVVKDASQPSGDIKPPTQVTTVPIGVATTQPTSLEIRPIPSAASQFPATQFSAAIPPSKGIHQGPIPIADSPEYDYLGGGFMGMVKDAFSSGGVLSKMAEKAKNSVDSIITTLDPQMSEYIYSGGDTEVTVISDLEDDVGAVREAFHSVFGKAWVNGIKLDMPPKAFLPIGLDMGWKEANEKIEYSLKFRNTPTIAIENILFLDNNDWYDLSLLVLRDNDRNISVKTFSQATPIPLDTLLREIETAGSQYKTLDVPQKLAKYLKNKNGWQQQISGLSKKETLLIAAKTLVNIYRSKLPEIQN